MLLVKNPHEELFQKHAKKNGLEETPTGLLRRVLVGPGIGIEKPKGMETIGIHGKPWTKYWREMLDQIL